MYDVLEIKRKNGNLIGKILSIDGRHRVDFAETNRLEKSLDIILRAGIEDVIMWQNEQIRFNAHPADPDFLEKVQLYLNVCYDFACQLKSKDEVNVGWKMLPETPYATIFYAVPKINTGQSQALIALLSNYSKVTKCLNDLPILISQNVSDTQQYFAAHRW